MAPASVRNPAHPRTGAIVLLPQRQVTAVSRSLDEDQQLGSNVDGHPSPAHVPTIPAGLSPTSRAGLLATTWPSRPRAVDPPPGDLLRHAAVDHRR
jgi:hypothetical protein